MRADGASIHRSRREESLEHVIVSALHLAGGHSPRHELHDVVRVVAGEFGLAQPALCAQSLGERRVRNRRQHAGHRRRDRDLVWRTAAIASAVSIVSSSLPKMNPAITSMPACWIVATVCGDSDLQVLLLVHPR